MARPKGSKNKKKEEKPNFSPPFSEEPKKREEAKPEPAAVVAEKPAPKSQSKSHSTWENNESQSVPKTRPTCRECGHGPETHYGSDSDWCNVQRCRCQGWQN